MAQSLAEKVATFAAEIPDWQIADVLNAPDAAANGEIAVNAIVSDARAILMTSGAWGKICLVADDTSQDIALRALCITVRDAHLTLSTFNMTDQATAAAVETMVGGLLKATLISQAAHDALLDLGYAPASWSDVNRAEPVTADDVSLIRGAKA